MHLIRWGSMMIVLLRLLLRTSHPTFSAPRPTAALSKNKPKKRKNNAIKIQLKICFQWKQGMIINWLNSQHTLSLPSTGWRTRSAWKLIPSQMSLYFIFFLVSFGKKSVTKETFFPSKPFKSEKARSEPPYFKKHQFSVWCQEKS